MGYLSCRAQSSISTSNSQTTSSASSKPPKPIKIQQFHYSDIEAATNNFSDQKLLGKGSHGYVYKAVLDGRLVAVKKPSRIRTHNLKSLPSFSPNEMINEVDNEIEILSRLQNPGLVNLLGFTNDPKDRILVVEFMSNGTLYDVLHSNSKTPNWGRRIRLALQIARAIETLHSSNPPVIHRDIKSANILLDRNYNARLADFGLAISGHANDYRVRSTPPAGTMGYLDPNYVTPDNLSTKTDVFSFGILLLEIISGRKAIDVGYSPPSIVDWAVPLIKKGKFLTIYDRSILPPKDEIVRKQLAVIAAKCVRSCKERRPSMKDVLGWLIGLSKLVPLNSWNGFVNPCLMVETVGRPVESRNAQLNSRVEGLESGRAMKNSRKVYSDLGFSNNLMDLMASNDEESGFEGDADGIEVSSKSKNRVFSSKFGSGRYDMRKRRQSRGYRIGRNDLDTRRNRSVGGSSEMSSRRDCPIAPSDFNVQADDCIY